MWQQLLGTDAFDADANLFDHGARSLLVVRALTELRRRGHVLSAVQVYEHPSVAAQAALLAVAPVAVRDAGAERERATSQRAAFARFGPGARGAR